MAPFASAVVPHPAPVATNGPIFFEARDPGEDGTDVFRINPDGTGLRNLTRDLPSAGGPFVSHDGTRVYFSVFSDPLHPENTRATSIYVMRPDGGGKVRIPIDDGASYPSVVGDTVVYQRCVLLTFTCTPFTAHLDGTGIRSLAPPLAEAVQPVLAPDGQRVVVMFRSTDPAAPPTPPGLRVLSLAGGPLTTVGGQLLDQKLGTWAASPSWSYDGTALVVPAGFPQFGAFLVASDGSDIEKLPWQGGQIQAVALSPDGREIAAQAITNFLSDTPGGEFRVTGLDGANDRVLRVTTSAEVGNRVSWSVATPPLPPAPVAPDGVLESVVPGPTDESIVLNVTSRRAQAVIAQGFVRIRSAAGQSATATTQPLLLRVAGRRIVRAANGKLARVKLVLVPKTKADRVKLRGLLRANGAAVAVRVAFFTKKGGERFRVRAATLRSKR